MSEAADCAFIFVESPLHVGTGQPGSVVDLPIARAETGGHPLIPDTSLRGSLLAEAKKRREQREITWAFGTPPGRQQPQVGALSILPAYLLLLPVRALRGAFAWITCPKVLDKWQETIRSSGLDVPQLPAFDLSSGGETARVAPESPLITSLQTVVLEDVSFRATVDPEIAGLGGWLSERALSDEPAYEFWRDRLPQRLTLLPDDAFDFFAQHSLPVTRRVAIDPRTGTAREGAMWTEEMLPSETLLYTVVTAAGEGVPAPVPVNAVSWLKSLEMARFQVGANRTQGGGIVRWTWLRGKRKET